MKTDFHAALDLMPVHRQQNARSRTLHLDDLLDGVRLMKDFSAGALDLVQMAYRYRVPGTEAMNAFRPDGKVSPEKLKDLWLLAYGALVSRTETPPSRSSDAAVNVARERFGERTVGITNAFCRSVSRNIENIRRDLLSEPSKLLPQVLHERWRDQPFFNRLGVELMKRPLPGIDLAYKDGNHQRGTLADLQQSSSACFAINPGSWNWMQFALRSSPQDFSPKNVLDACAAPGGKLLTLGFALEKRGINTFFVAADSKKLRLQRLEENLHRLNFKEKVRVVQHDWYSSETANADVLGGPFDLGLVDLPCSGSGTYASRPDALTEDLNQRVRDLEPLQTGILNAVSPLCRTLWVSLCSVDPQEIENVSKALWSKPVFSSWNPLPQDNEVLPEGIVGWMISGSAR